MGQRPGRMHRASAGLRCTPNMIRDRGVNKCPGIESPEINNLMHKLKKVQGTKTPNTVVLLTRGAWRSKGSDDCRNGSSSSTPRQNFPYGLRSDVRLKMVSVVPRKDCVERHGATCTGCFVWLAGWSSEEMPLHVVNLLDPVLEDSDSSMHWTETCTD